MLKRLLVSLTLTIVFLVGSTPKGEAARRHDPEIRKYLKEKKQRRKEQRELREKERRADPYRKIRPYQTLDEIYAELDEMLANNPGILTGGVYGKSVEGRELRWIGMETGERDKPQVLISANIHAQELAGGQMAMALLRHFVKEYGKDCRVTALIDGTDLYFIPVLNPDGMARCVRQQNQYGITSFVRKNSDRVDLNRNFPYPPTAPKRLKDPAGSPRKCSQTHRGPKPLSEPETKALIDFIDAHHFMLSLNYHTTGGMILYPPGTFPEQFPDTKLMSEIAMAYRAEQFDKYAVFPSIGLYPTIGSLDDYLYHRYGILSFTVEVGRNQLKRAMIPRNGSWSPVFWGYNVYYLEREMANNVPGAMVMIEYAIKAHEDPSLLKWRPSDTLWVGEPPRQENRGSKI